ncbi:MAG: hypothetical protein KDA38_05880, partial [Planctomycetales bacterium]|nr:hypothetical protein [Planctomycetales bacterium]
RPEPFLAVTEPFLELPNRFLELPNRFLEAPWRIEGSPGRWMTRFLNLDEVASRLSFDRADNGPREYARPVGHAVKQGDCFGMTP